MNRLLLLALAFAFSALAQSQNVSTQPSQALAQGEEIFAKTCATGYCHGVRGASSGAPRLAGRGFTQEYIYGVITRGIPGAGMPSFASVLSKANIAAVAAYVAKLNGIENPTVTPPDDEPSVAPARSALTGEAARGSQLFADALHGFGRCSTCHQTETLGIPVASPIAQVPASVAALKSLATPNVKTTTFHGESVPALVLRDTKQGALFYDLTSLPPVERSTEPGEAAFAAGSGWRHASVIGAYNDSELEAILTYLRAVIRP